MSNKKSDNTNNDKHTPNDKRSIVKNENNIAHEKDRLNTIKQIRDTKKK